MNTAGEHVTITEITDLIAWARHLSVAFPGAPSPTQLAAFHAAKADLFARIENPHTSTPPSSPNPGKDI